MKASLHAVRLFVALFLVSFPIFSQTQKSLQYDIEYQCGGERIVVDYCRRDSDQFGMPRTLDAANYCQVYYPDRPKRNGFMIFAAVLRGEIENTLQACGALGGNQSATPSAVNRDATRGVSGPAVQAFENGRKLVNAKDYTGGMVALKEAVLLDPRFAIAFHYIGIAQFYLREYTVANAAFERALQLGVESPQSAYCWIGDCQRALGQPDKAIIAYREAVLIKPDHSVALNGIGLGYFEKNDYANALIFFEQASRLSPNQGMYRRNVAFANVRLGRKADAMREYNTLVTIDQTLAKEVMDEINRPPRGAAEVKLDEGLKLYDAKDYQKALAAFQEALRLKPDLANASHQIGRSYYAVKQYPQAIEAFQNAIRLKIGNEYFVHDWIGNSYYFLNQLDKAIASFSESLRQKPDYDIAATNLGHSHFALKQYTEALPPYQIALRLKPNDPAAHSNLGSTFYELGQYEKAIEPFREAIRLKPDDAFVMSKLANAHYILKQYPEALAAYQSAVKVKPNEPVYQSLIAAKPKADVLADAHYGISNIYNEQKKYELALSEIKNAQSIEAKHNYSYELGYAYFGLKQFPNALAAFQDSVRLKPDYMHGHYWIGLTFGEMEQFDKAIPALQEAIRLDPKHKDAHFMLGHSYRTLGRKAEALSEVTALRPLDAKLARELLAAINKP